MNRSPITSREFRLPMADGTALFVADSVLDSAAERGGVVLMHGLSEHSGRYQHVVRFFNACGWSVRRYDHRGHGRSGGAWGDVPDHIAMIQDAKIVIDDFSRKLAAPPLLLGHSMGGLFAARFATADLSPLRGLILASPALAVSLSLTQKLLLKMMRVVAPGFSVSNGLKPGYLTHDPAANAAYLNDSLIHPVISARLLSSMLDAIEFAQAHAAALAIPTLMLVAGDDHIVEASGSQVFFQNLVSGIGTMHCYDDFYHELFNERDAYRVFDDVQAWLACV